MILLLDEFYTTSSLKFKQCRLSNHNQVNRWQLTGRLLISLIDDV